MPACAIATTVQRCTVNRPKWARPKLRRQPLCRSLRMSTRMIQRRYQLFQCNRHSKRAVLCSPCALVEWPDRPSGGPRQTPVGQVSVPRARLFGSTSTSRKFVSLARATPECGTAPSSRGRRAARASNPRGCGADPAGMVEARAVAIPAGAGPTWSSRQGWVGVGSNPRGCGADYRPDGGVGGDIEQPPRVRGRRGACRRSTGVQRATPAGAGPTSGSAGTTC